MKCITLLIALLSIPNVNAQTWHQVASGTSKKLNTIFFASNEIGYIGGDDSLLLKTTDGGANWTPLVYSGVDFIPSGFDDNIINLKFVSESIGFMTVGPYSNGLFKTIDGGLNWTLYLPSEEPLCYNYGLYMFAENNGYLGGSNCFTSEKIQHISEAGITPRPIADAPTGGAMVVDIDFLNENKGIAVGGYHGTGAVLLTADGGLTWTSVESGLTGDSDQLTSVLIVNDTLAYIGYNPSEVSYGLLISHDGGLTWNYDPETTTFYYPEFNCLHQSGNNTIYTGGSTNLEPSGVIFEKEIDSDWWNTESVEYGINAMSSYADSVVWGVGDSGYIVVNQDPSTLGLNAYQTDNNSDQIRLYPNPATDHISISFKADSKNQSVQTEIYTLQGEKVFNAKEFASEIDIHNLCSGMYILSVTLENQTRYNTFFSKN